MIITCKQKTAYLSANDTTIAKPLVSMKPSWFAMLLIKVASVLALVLDMYNTVPFVFVAATVTSTIMRLCYKLVGNV